MNESALDEFKRRGFVLGADGFYHKVGKAARVDSPGPPSELERHPGNGAVGAVQVQERNSDRFLIRVTSIRRRLLDEDNLCEKFHVDCCRYSGLLPGDGPGKTKIEVTQKKAEPGEGERVVIEIFSVKP